VISGGWGVEHPVRQIPKGVLMEEKLVEPGRPSCACQVWAARGEIPPDSGQNPRLGAPTTVLVTHDQTEAMTLGIGVGVVLLAAWAQGQIRHAGGEL